MRSTLLMALLCVCVCACETTNPVAVQQPKTIKEAVLGQWTFQSIKVMFLDEKNNDKPLSVPTTVFPDRDTVVPFLDGRPSKLVKFQGFMEFDATGDFHNQRKIWWDKAIIEDTGAAGTWAQDGNRILLTVPGFRVHAFVNVLDSEHITLLWDRQDPEFKDDSCVILITLARAH